MRAVGLLLLALAAGALLWEAGWAMSGLRRVNPVELRALLGAANPPLLVDVRTPMEFRWMRIPGAVNAPFGSDELRRLLDRESGDRAVVLVCMTGHRSPVSAWRLGRSGLEVMDLAGGMVRWKLSGGVTVGGPTP